MVYQWLFSGLRHLWPTHCYLCQQAAPATGLCSACRADLPVWTATCQTCGLPLVTPAAGPVCTGCRQQRPPFDRVISAVAYTTPVSRLITGLKFHRQLHYAQLLGALLLEEIAVSGTSVQAIVPVPLHAGRLRERGFNQALEIARPLARALALPLLVHHLQRHRATAPQSTQAPTQRLANVQNAFNLVQPLPYKHIALVDDVMTSGHTLREAARCLRAAGVEQIEVWCAARAMARAC